MEKSRFLLLSLALIVSMITKAQGILGTVTDELGEPIIGASVVEKANPQNGAITDLDGKFTLNVTEGTPIIITYIGYSNQEVNARNNMTVMMKEDSETLQDVVVIGYGVQKKSVVTASIAKVSSDDLDGKTRLRAEDALKGMAAGVNVTSSSGQPGSKSMIRIRGVGTINNSEPLYIVDGMPTDQNGMESVNPSDIESIEVLKDAASGAIYGARAANGVILVTTKKGKLGKVSVNYNFSYGWQSAWKKRDVTGATDYAILQNERRVQNGLSPLYNDPYNLVDANDNKIIGFGTNWQDLLFNDNAPIVQHDVSISGASEKVNYYLSMGYFTQDGIVGGNYGQSNYDRLTIRSNNQFNILDASKERNFLNKLDVGANLSYMRVHNTSLDANSTWGSPLGSALYLAPTLPVTLTQLGYDRIGEEDVPRYGQAMIDRYKAYDLYYDANGYPYTIPNYVGSYNEQNNPIAMMHNNPNKNWSHKFMPKFSLDLQLYDALKYHFSYSAELSFWGYNGATLQKYYLSGNNNSDHTQAAAYKGNNTTWQIENTLTYDKTFGKHTIGVVLGQSAMKFKGDELGGSHWNLVNPNKPSINYTTGGNLELTNDADGKVTGAKSLVGVCCTNIGMYDEALNILDSIRLTNDLEKNILGTYYEAYNNVYSELSYYTRLADMRKNYLDKAYHYEQLMYENLPATNEACLLKREQRAQGERKFDESMAINDEWLKTVEPGSHPYALTALYRYIEYKLKGDSTQMMYWLTESVLADIKNAAMDQGSMWELANELMLKGDLDRASHYISYTSDCANRYGSRQLGKNLTLVPILGYFNHNMT